MKCGLSPGCVAVLLFLFLAGNLSLADEPAAWLDIEDLSAVRVTTATRSAEEYFVTPAAVAVIGERELAESSDSTVPELLRIVPGLNVAQISNRTWAIGSRGFQWQFSNKLLVMVDGRSIYSPAAGGVRWEDLALFTPDLKQIEVVRGPGSATWGANAVNGVIAIESLSSFDTIGSRGHLGVGNQRSSDFGWRQGWKFSDRDAIRVSAVAQTEDHERLPSGRPAQDATKAYRVGFRWDRALEQIASFSLSGDLFVGRVDYSREFAALDAPPSYQRLITTTNRNQVSSLVARWNRRIGAQTKFEWNSYVEQVHRDVPQSVSTLRTIDTELLLSRAVGMTHQLSAVAGYRLIDGDLHAGLVAYVPSEIETQLFSAALEDRWQIVSDRLALNAGVRLEHHSFTGWQPQPTLRLSFTPSRKLTLWGSLARAVRTPTWVEEFGRFEPQVLPPGAFHPSLPTVVSVRGNDELAAEKLNSVEIGTRWMPGPNLSLELDLYHYRYRDYVLVTAEAPYLNSDPLAIVLPTHYANGINGSSDGGEFAVRWEINSRWRWSANWSVVDTALHARLSDPFSFERDAVATPRHSASLGTDVRLGADWTLGFVGRYVGQVIYYSIPQYKELDFRAHRSLGKQWGVTLSGRNMLHRSHLEYDSALYRQLTEIERSVLLSVDWNR